MTASEGLFHGDISPIWWTRISAKRKTAAMIRDKANLAADEEDTIEVVTKLPLSVFARLCQASGAVSETPEESASKLLTTLLLDDEFIQEAAGTLH